MNLPIYTVTIQAPEDAMIVAGNTSVTIVSVDGATLGRNLLEAARELYNETDHNWVQRALRGTTRTCCIDGKCANSD